MATKVTLTWGPITAPAKIYNAVKDDDDSKDTHTVCIGKDKDKPHKATRVNSLYRCPESTCLREGPSYHTFPVGRDNGDGTYTVVPRETLNEAGPGDDVTKTITLLACPKDEMDAKALPSGKFRYVGPESGPGLENYGLIRDLIRATEGEIAWTAVWAARSAPVQQRVVLAGDVICIQEIAFPGQVALPPNVDVPAYNPAYFDMAIQAVDILRTNYDPANFFDVTKLKRAELWAAGETMEAGSAVATPVEQGGDRQLADMKAWLESRGRSIDKPKAAPKKRAAVKVAAERRTA